MGRFAARSALALSVVMSAAGLARGSDNEIVVGNSLSLQSDADEPRRNILLRLRFGLQAYKKGEKGEAFEAYREVAEQNFMSSLIP